MPCVLSNFFLLHTFFVIFQTPISRKYCIIKKKWPQIRKDHHLGWPPTCYWRRIILQDLVTTGNSLHFWVLTWTETQLRVSETRHNADVVILQNLKVWGWPSRWGRRILSTDCVYPRLAQSIPTVGYTSILACVLSFFFLSLVIINTASYWPVKECRRGMPRQVLVTFAS